MSFINLRLLWEDGIKQEALKPGEKLCPLMSRYGLESVPMEKEPQLTAFTIICVGEHCGKYNECFNLPAKSTTLRNPNAA